MFELRAHGLWRCLKLILRCRVAARAAGGILAVVLASGTGLAADVTFNISYIAEANPFPPNGTTFSYADVWSENGFAYLGSDRGFSAANGAQGISVFSISNAGVPTFLPPSTNPPGGYAATTYFGSEMEDVEVYDGIGYFASDVNGSSGRTGVDIVDLAIPFDPIQLSRVDTSVCLPRNGSVCAHGKVHTLSIQRFNENTPSEERFLYTSDNETDVIKISNVSDPENPFLVRSLDIGAPSGVASHEVVVRDNRLFVASKGSSNTTNGWFHIYDVADPANPVLLKAFLSGAKTHTAMPTYDGNTLIVAEERQDGNVLIYDISMIGEPNDPQNPLLLATLNDNNVCRDGSCISAHSPHHVHVHGNLVFLTWYEAGLQVFNIADPANPIYVGAFDTYPGTSSNFNGNWGVDLSHGLNRVLLSDRSRGLIVVDASGVLVPGDYDRDMDVDADDYAVWRSEFGATRINVHDPPLADGNFDGIVDAADYVFWREHFGQTGAGAGKSSITVAVPEPATILSLLVVAAGLIDVRCRVRKAVNKDR